MQTTDFVTTLFDAHGNPGKVTVALTMSVNALRKGHTTLIILMADGVELGKPNATDGIDIGQPFEPASKLLATYLELGGRVALCSSCMTHHGITADDLAPGYEVITAPDVIDLLTSAKGSLQVT